MCNVARKGHARDSHFLLRAILDYPHKNACDFEGTRELVALKHQVAFELYRMKVKLELPVMAVSSSLTEVGTL